MFDILKWLIIDAKTTCISIAYFRIVYATKSREIFVECSFLCRLSLPFSESLAEIALSRSSYGMLRRARGAGMGAGCRVIVRTSFRARWATNTQISTNASTIASPSPTKVAGSNASVLWITSVSRSSFKNLLSAGRHCVAVIRPVSCTEYARTWQYLPLPL